MGQTVELPDQSTIDFPDDFSLDQINDAVRSHLGKTQGQNLFTAPRFQPSIQLPQGTPEEQAQDVTMAEEQAHPFTTPLGGKTEFPTGAEITEQTGLPKAISVPVSAVGRMGAGVADYLTTPQGVTETALSFTPAGAAVRLKWAYDMLKGGALSAKDAVDRVRDLIHQTMQWQVYGGGRGPKPISDEDVQALAEDAVNTAGGMLFGAGTAAHGLREAAGIARQLRQQAPTEPPVPSIGGPLSPEVIQRRLAEEAAKQPIEKGAQDAIQIRSPEAVPVGETPEGSAEVGRQVRDAQTPALPQAQVQEETPSPPVPQVEPVLAPTVERLPGATLPKKPPQEKMNPVDRHRFEEWARGKTVSELRQLRDDHDNDPTKHYDDIVESINKVIKEKSTSLTVSARPPGVNPDATEWITAAAYNPSENIVETGPHHPAILERLGVKGFESRESRNTPSFGFSTNLRPFVDRIEGGKIAESSGQKIADYENEPFAHSNEIASPTEPDKALSETSTDLPEAKAETTPAPPSDAPPEQGAAVQKVPSTIGVGDRVRWIPNPGVKNFGPVEGVVQDIINEGDGIHIASDDPNLGVQRRWMQDGTIEPVTTGREAIEKYLTVAVPDVADARSRVKAIDRQQAELKDERKVLESKRKELEPKVTLTRGPRYKRGRIKASARASDLKDYRETQQKIAELDKRIFALDDAATKDRQAIDESIDAGLISDKSRPLLRRLDRAVRRLGGQAPKELVAALRSETARVIREKYPDATAEEITRLTPEVERGAYFYDDPFKDPGVPNLYDLRRGSLKAALENAPTHQFPDELNDRIKRHLKDVRVYGEKPSPLDPVEDLSAKGLADLKSDIATTTKATIAENEAADKRKQAEEAAEKAKEDELIANAQKVADSAKRPGTPGGRSAKEVKDELATRIQEAVAETVEQDKVTLRQEEDGSYIATGESGSWSTGEIEKAGKGFKVTTRLPTFKGSDISASVETLDEAKAIIKGMAATGKGRAIIAVPGDGVFRLHRYGPSLLNIWKQAKAIDTRSTVQTAVSRSGVSTAEAKDYIQEAREFASAKEIEGKYYAKRGDTWWEIQKYDPKGEPEHDTKVESESLIAKLEAKSEPPKGIIAGSAAEKWADDVLKGGGTHGGPDVLAAYIVKGAAVIERGITDFAKWSAEMLRQFGEAVRPHLQEVWDAAKEMTRHQVAGIPQAGVQYQPESIKAQQDFIRANYIEGNAPVTAQNTERAWQLFDAFTGPRKAEVAQEATRFVAGQMAPGLVKKEIWDYAIQMAMHGDPSLLQNMFEHHADFQTIGGGTGATAEEGGITEAARVMRAGKEMSDSPLFNAIKRLTEQREAAAGRVLGTGPELFRQIVNTINAVRLEPDALEAALKTVKGADGRSLEDILPESTEDPLLTLITTLPLPELPAELSIKTAASTLDRIKALFPLANIRDFYEKKGASGLARDFWQMLAGTKPEEGALWITQAAIRRELGQILKESFVRHGVEPPAGAPKLTSEEKLARYLGDKETRQSIVGLVDKDIRTEIEMRRAAELAKAGEDDALRQAIEDKYEQWTDVWDDATSSMLVDTASEALLRRLVRQKAKELEADWEKLTGDPKAADAFRDRLVDSVSKDVLDASQRGRPTEWIGDVQTGLRVMFDRTLAIERNRIEMNKAAKARRIGEAEARRAAREAERKANAADDYAKRLVNSLQKQQTEWLKPDSDPNKVQAIISESMRTEDEDGRLINPIPQSDAASVAWMRDFAEKLVGVGVKEETAGALAKEIHDKRLRDWANERTRAIGRAVGAKSIRSLVEAVLSTPYRAQTDLAWRQRTAMDWLMSNGMSREQAESIYPKISKEIDAALVRARETAATRLLKGTTDEQRLDSLIKAIRIGLKDPTRQWSDELAARAGFKSIPEAQLKQLAELEHKFSDPNISPPEQVRLVEQMFRVMRHVGSHDNAWSQALGESFASSLLSGPRTATLHLFQPAFSLVVRDLPVSAIFNPRDAGTLAAALVEAGKNFFPEFRFAWKNDAYAFANNRMVGLHNELKRQLEIGVEDLKKGNYIGALRLIYAWGHYVGRFLQTANQAGMAVTREWKLAAYGSQAMRAAGLNTRQIGELIDFTSTAKRAAYEDGVDRLGLDKNTARVRADYVVAEQLQDFFANRVGDTEGAKIARNSEADAYSVVGRMIPGLNDEQEGFLRKKLGLSSLLEVSKKWRREGGVKSIAGIAMFGFVHIPLRTALFNANFFGYGLFRYGVYKYRTARGLDTPWKQSYANDMQARQRLHEAIVGTALGLGALAWAFGNSTADPEADKKRFGVYATGQGPKSRVLRDAWEKQGYKPFSLIVVANGRVVGAVPITRVGGALAWPMGLAAAHDDAEWRRKEAAASGRPVKSLIASEVMQAIGTYYQIVGAQGIFQAMSHFNRVSEGGGGVPKIIADTASTAIGGVVIPGKQLLTTISEMMVGPLDRSSIESDIAANLPVIGALPNLWKGRPDWLPTQQRAMNRFGDQLYDQSWYGKAVRLNMPFAVRVSDNPDNKELYTTLLDKGAAPPELRRTVIEERYGPLTDRQWSTFAKTSGQLLKSDILSQLPDLKNQAPEDVKKSLTKSATAANEEAADSLGLERVKPLKGRAAPTAVAPSEPSPTAGVRVPSGKVGGGGRISGPRAPSLGGGVRGIRGGGRVRRIRLPGLRSTRGRRLRIGRGPRVHRVRLSRGQRLPRATRPRFLWRDASQRAYASLARAFGQ